MNRTEITNIYIKVSELINQYKDGWNISPLNLAKYLKKDKIELFINRNDLSNVPNITKIVSDVIDDILLDDKIKTKTKISEQMEQNQSMNYKKLLADFFKTSIGHIEAVDGMENKFNVTQLGKKTKSYYILTLNDIKEMKNEIIKETLDDITSKLGQSEYNFVFDIIGVKQYQMNLAKYIDIALIEQELMLMNPTDVVNFFKSKYNTIYIGDKLVNNKKIFIFQER